jgi:hypothetical protein
MYNGSTWIYGNWFTAVCNGERLGEGFAYQRYDLMRCRTIAKRDAGSFLVSAQAEVGQVTCDRLAIQTLFKTRQQQLDILSSKLKSSSAPILGR